MKKFLGSLLIIMLLFSVVPNNVFVANASTTASQIVNEATIEKRIDELYSKLGNKYFTTDQKSASSSSDRSLNSNVIASSWFKNLFGIKSLSVNQFPESPRTYAKAKSCSGFATFAEWYIFRNKNTDNVKITELDKMDFNYTNVANYARKGDIISLSGTKKDGTTAGHELIFISADSKGIYVLDSNWANSCKVTKHTIEYSYCTKFQIGRAKNSGAISIKTNDNKNNSNKTEKSPTVNITSYPKTINRGDTYGLRGTINANGGLTEIRGYILDSKGKTTIQSSTLQTTTSSAFDIKSSNVNNQLCFDKLDAGTYKLRITAKNSKGTAKFEKTFTVKEKGSSKPPKIDVTSYPKSIKKGSSYGLRGSINANGGSTEVRGYILNSNGKTVQSTTLEKTSSSSFDIRYSNVNEQLLFNKLGKGTYTLKITAKNSKGTTTFSKKFTVK